MSTKSKKIVYPTLFIILILVTFLFGVTFAYFSVLINNSKTMKIEGNTDDVGNVILRSKNNLLLNLSAVHMMNKGKDVNYYASLTGEPTTEENDITIAEIDINSDNTINCQYTLVGKITGNNNMYNAFKKMKDASIGQLVMMVAGKEYDLYTTSFPLVIKGETGNINSNSNQSIKASFKLVNKASIDQSDLAGTDLTIYFTMEEFNCEIAG